MPSCRHTSCAQQAGFITSNVITFNVIYQCLLPVHSRRLSVIRHCYNSLGAPISLLAFRMISCPYVTVVLFVVVVVCFKYFLPNVH